HNPYFRGPRERESVSKAVAIADVEAKTDSNSWNGPRLCMRNVASSTNQRTFVVGLMPIAAHGNSAPTLDGMSWGEALRLKSIVGSLVVDYIVRMKVSANLNWFYLETIPIADWESDAEAARVHDLTKRLNAVGIDFGEPTAEPFLTGDERMLARL